MTEVAASYGTALISLLVFTLIVLVQSALVGAAKANASLTPGQTPEPEYGSNVYRLNRSHQNGLEVMAAAAIALVACILAGVSPGWVNGLMAVFLLTRIAYIVIYARNVGKPVQGPRTIAFVSGWAALVVMCLMAIWALL